MTLRPQISNDTLLRSINNLINICENSRSDLGRHREKLNSILNDLNSIEFKYVQNLDIIKVSVDCICSLIIKQLNHFF